MRRGRAGVVPAVRAAVARADPEQPVSDVRLMTDIVEDETSSRSAQLRALAFAALAVLLACLGIHGLLRSWSPRARRRLASAWPSAPRAGRCWRWCGGSAVLAGMGAGVGLSGALRPAARCRRCSPASAPPTRRPSPAAAAVAFTMALVGSLAPARRAVGVDPLAAIRTE